MLAKALALPAFTRPAHAVVILKKSFTLDNSMLRYLGKIMHSTSDATAMDFAVSQLRTQTAGDLEKLKHILSCLLDLSSDMLGHIDRVSMDAIGGVAKKLSYGADEFSALATIKGYLPEALYNPYQVLGLPTGASLDAVIRAYRRLVQDVHPDVLNSKNPIAVARAQEKTARINDAYMHIKKARRA
jgi:DnaJ-domain-containing protein 1